MSVTIGQQLSDILRRKVEGALVISGEMVADRVRKNIPTNRSWAFYADSYACSGTLIQNPAVATI